MTLDEVRAAFESRLKTNWSATEIAWSGADFDAGTDPWIRFTLLPADSENSCIGGPIRHWGTAVVQVFIPFGRGSGEAFSLADSLVALFQNTTFDGVTVYAGSMRNLGADNYGWYQVNVLLPYWAQ